MLVRVSGAFFTVKARNSDVQSRSDNKKHPDEQEIDAFTHVVDSSHRPIEQRRGRHEVKIKKRTDRQRFPEKSLIWQAQDASVF
jgi:hypothetical protein